MKSHGARAMGYAPDEGVPADALTLSGGAVDLYLALWNRGGTVDDPDEVLTRWREPAKITW
jgi:hypothetical protein